MKTLVHKLLLLSILTSSSAIAQVGVNHVDPHPSSVLDMVSESRGVLIPRMTATQKAAIADPAQGLLVYVTDDNLFSYFDGTQWVDLASATNLDSIINDSTSTVLEDLDMDTKVEVEQSPDEDAIRLTVAGQNAGFIGASPTTTALGVGAGSGITDGFSNVLIGTSAGIALTSEFDNTLLGHQTGMATVDGVGNTMTGSRAGETNIGGDYNSFY